VNVARARPHPRGVADYESGIAKDTKADLRLWLRLLSCTTLIERTLRRRLRREFGITLPIFDVLAQLDRAPGGLPMGELSRRLMVTKGNVTGLVGRVVALGHAERRRDLHDQRVQVVRLTKKGGTLFARIATAHHGWIAEAMGGLSDGERDRLYRLLGGLKSSVRGAFERTPDTA
jgi:DNA-binding MarR family transcriptional regulator